MRRFLLSISLLFPFAFAVPATAQDIPDCANASNNVEITACVWDAYKRADAELNAVWKQVMASIQPEDYIPVDAVKQWKDDLLAAQRAWITFKEKDCDAVAYEWYGGSGANMAVGSCLYGHTVARTNDLKERYLGR
jgi:uncharacterized protein YecT (DUF1311 family)